MGIDGPKLLLFALHPLLIPEATIGFHFDPVVMFLLLGLAGCLTTGRRTGAAAFWAGAVGWKLFPLLLAPIVFRRVGWKRMSIAVAALAVIHIPFLNRQTLSVYLAFAETVANPSPLAMLLPGWLKLVALAGIVAWFTHRPGNHGAAVFYPVLALLLLSNTVHPWYVLWILPIAFLALRERWPVVLWSLVLFSAYDALLSFFRHGVWEPSGRMQTAIWLLFLLTLGLAGCRGNWLRSPGPRPPTACSG